MFHRRTSLDSLFVLFYVPEFFICLKGQKKYDTVLKESSLSCHIGRTVKTKIDSERMYIKWIMD
jgi:hypothetical protein